MIYLFGSGSWKGTRKVVKVGYTGNLETRKEQYRLHNPLGEMIDSREGDEVLEEKLHLRLTDWKVEFLDEWFYDEPEVFKIFQEPIEEIDSWLWKERGRVLIYPVIPLPGSLKRKILDELMIKYGQSLILGQK